MMTELKYDPELPFAYLDDQGVQLFARFKHRFDAEAFRERCNFGTVVDTTPKPKIPEDAEVIYYYTSGYDFYARQLENGDWKTDGGVLYSYSEILEVVEVAEVTVLVRKDAT